MQALMMYYSQCSDNDLLRTSGKAHRMLMGIEMSQIVTTDIESLSMGPLS